MTGQYARHYDRTGQNQQRQSIFQKCIVQIRRRFIDVFQIDRQGQPNRGKCQNGDGPGNNKSKAYQALINNTYELLCDRISIVDYGVMPTPDERSGYMVYVCYG